MRRDPLRFYPRAWRDRYGEEMRALLEDDLGGLTPPRRYRARLALSGLRERARAAGVAGDSPVDARRWAGSSVILFSWVALCAAGGSFAKSAEHFRSALSPGARSAPSVAYVVVVAGALAGALLIAAGAAVALPSFAASVRARKVLGIGRATAVAAGASVVVILGTAGISLWAHQLGAASRNGADGAYSVAVVAWALTGVCALALWARVATRAARTCLSPRALLVESRLAIGVATAATVVAVASAVWWAETASHAPVFLTGVTGSSALTARAVGTLGLMAVAAASGLYGVVRITSARR